MQKTKLGITVGLLGAAIYFTGLFGGFLVAIVLAGYSLMFEENEWLKKNAVKAIALMVFFAMLSAVVNLIPDTISFINYVAGIFGGYVNVGILSFIASVIESAVSIIEKILFIVLGIKALNQGTVAVPVVDKLIGKYI